ncbi:MAG: uroporphyrinogen decarboxylase family protein [Candidatus Humimicrobiaceae bacterium]
MVEIRRDIKYLLWIYDKLVSQNSSRILDSLNRTTRALHYQNIDRIPICQTTQTIIYPRHEIFYSPEKNLIMQLANIILTLEHKTDYVPFLDPFEGVTVLAEAFGCKVEIPINGDPWVKNPIIYNPTEVYDLKKPAKNNEVYKRVLETLKFFEKKTGYVIPIGVTDPQSPLNIASLMWGNNNFIISCITNPKEVHYLLDIVTDSFIDFYKMQYDTLKNPAFPVHSFQLVNSNDGISISDDEVILMSPELYKEFGIPYINKISDAFGGIYYHSCGDFGNFLDLVLEIDGLRAINAHLSPKEFKPEYIRRVLNKRIGIFLGISDREIGWDDTNIWKPEDIITIYDKYYIPNAISKSEGKGLVLVGYGGYAGYINLLNSGKKKGMLIDTSGHIIENNPLINLSVEEKNKNFDHILCMLSDNIS